MIDTIFFDLDNTLYPASASMEADIVDRMAAFAGAWLGTTKEEAMARRRDYLSRYGTTLEWLMAEHGFEDYDQYFAAVHPAGEEEVLPVDPDLPAMLAGISQDKYILTNAPLEHAERILDKFGISGFFKAVYDVRFNKLVGKPAASAYQRVLAASGSQAHTSLFIDDVPRYVAGFVACGGQGLLIDHFDKHSDSPLPRIRTIHQLPAVLERGLS